MKKILSLIEEKIGNGKRVRIFESDYYTVKSIKEKNYTNINIISKGKFIPDIATNFDLYTCTLKGFEIGTTSYGDTTKEDIKAIIEGFEVALITVEQLEEIFKDLMKNEE